MCVPAVITDTETHCFNFLDTTNDTTWLASQNTGSWFASSPSSPLSFANFLAAYADRLGIDPTAAAGEDAQAHVVIGKQSWRSIFTNQGSMPAEVTYWVCYPRRDVPTATSFRTPLSYGSATTTVMPDLLYDGFTDYKNEFAAGQTWDNTVYGTVTSLAGGATGTNPAQNAKDMTPYLAKNWCSLFKLSRPRRFILGLGESKRINLTDMRSKSISLNRFGLSDGDSIPDNFYYLRDNGPILLFHVKAAPAHDELQVDSTMYDQDLQPQAGLYSVTCMVDKSYDLFFPTIYDNRPMKMRMGGVGSSATYLGATGFTGPTPFNTIALAANESKLETRLPVAPTEVAFNT